MAYKDKLKYIYVELSRELLKGCKHFYFNKVPYNKFFVCPFLIIHLEFSSVDLSAKRENHFVTKLNKF